MSSTNKGISFKGHALSIIGNGLIEGQTLPEFKLTGPDMNDVTSDDFKGKVLIIASVPSIDTPVCSMETKRFNQEAANLGDKISILTVSMDTPFAFKRWCGAEGVENVSVASDYKCHKFGESFGVLIQEWGLLCRAIFVADTEGKIVHVEYVSDVSNEPDYAMALEKAKAALKQ